jgi:SAM-dependent methyltransferase
VLRDGIVRSLGRFSGPAGRTNEARRDAWLQRNLMAIPAGSVLLDAGAGTQRCSRFCTHLKYVSQDFCRYDGEGDTTGLQSGVFDYGRTDIVSDITSIPREDASFDAIMAIEVLEHLPDPLSALREFERLLRPRGHLLLTAPFCSLTHQAPYHFTSGFNSKWYTLHLPALGFRILDLESNGNFFEFLAQEIRRSGDVARRYATTRPTWCERLAMGATLRMMGRVSQQDKGSAELLCYGYHVHAVKD